MSIEYEISIVRLPDEEGGGYIAVIADLQGCMSDGETPQEALENVMDAFEQWREAQLARGRAMPEPGESYNEAHEKLTGMVETLKEQSEVIKQQAKLIRKHEKRIESMTAELEKLRRSSAPVSVISRELIGAMEGGWHKGSLPRRVREGKVVALKK